MLVSVYLDKRRVSVSLDSAETVDYDAADWKWSITTKVLYIYNLCRNGTIRNPSGTRLDSLAW